MSYTYELVTSFERAASGMEPWVCVESDCDEALPADELGDSCPRCGSDMIRSPYSRIVKRGEPARRSS